MKRIVIIATIIQAALVTLAIVAGVRQAPANTFRVDTLQVDNNATVNGGTTTSALDVAPISTLALSATTNNAAVGSGSLLRTTSAGVVTVTGMDSTGRSDGSLLWVQAPTTGTLSFSNESPSSLAPNRIDTPGSGTWSTSSGGYTLFNYNATLQRWQWMEAGTAIFPTLDVNGNAAISGQFNSPIMIVGAQNTRARGGLPTVNHGTVATGSSDWYGSITGVGANTSTTVTYSGVGFNNRSFCMTSPKSGTQLQNVTTLFSSFTVTCVDSISGLAENCVDFFYTCAGN